LKTNKAEGYVR